MATRPNAKVFVNLDHLTYWSLLACASAMVGNSSSGIMETASLGVPTVDIGLRQKGRERAANVLHADPVARDIVETVRRALDPAFRRSLQGIVNPYGDGRASERIVEVLARVELGEGLLTKRPVPLDPRWQP